MKYLVKFTMLCFAFAVLFTSGCKKLSSDTSLLVLNVRPYFGNDSIIYGKSFRSASGDSISFNRTAFYISGVQLATTSGTSVVVPGYILVTPSAGLNIILGSIPTGTYKSISFNIGIDASTNHLDPAGYTTGPLANQSPSMHFSTNTDGYIFMAAEGLADSTNGNLSPNKTFSYHIGTDSLLKAVSLPDHSVSPYTAFNATGTKLVTINIIADFSQLLQHVNIPHQPITNTTDNKALADTLAAHIPGMFRYQN